MRDFATSNTLGHEPSNQNIYNLELSDPGFDFTILSDFRKRLVEGGAEQLLLDAMLALLYVMWNFKIPYTTCIIWTTSAFLSKSFQRMAGVFHIIKEQGWLKERQRQRSDSTHVLAKVRAINRLMCVSEAMRFGLNTLAIVAGEWLLDHSDPEWVDRYGHRIEESRLPHSQQERQVVGSTHRPRWFEVAD